MKHAKNVKRFDTADKAIGLERGALIKVWLYERVIQKRSGKGK